MKTIFTYLIFFISLTSFSQNELRVNYTKIIDYDGVKRRENIKKGTWYVSQDSLLIQKYGKDSLVYKIVEIEGRRVNYINDYNEIVNVVFMNKSLTVKNGLRPDEYVIFREE